MSNAWGYPVVVEPFIQPPAGTPPMLVQVGEHVLLNPADISAVTADNLGFAIVHTRSGRDLFLNIAIHDLIESLFA